MSIRLAENIYLIASIFRVTDRIDGLPFYHGPHWSALFRNLHRLLHGKPMPPGIGIIPLETGMNSLNPGDIITVHLNCPAGHWNLLRGVLERFNEFELRDGHFVPGKTIKFIRAFCRVSGVDVLSENPSPLSDEDVNETVRALSGMGSLTLSIYTPMRLTRPRGTKTDGHRYVDAEFFSNGGNRLFAGHLLNALRHIHLEETPSLSIEASPLCLAWVDTPYGNHSKTIGGIIGKVVLKNISEPIIPHLIAGQFTGAGKNQNFGFGHYLIEESLRFSPVRPPERCLNPFEQPRFNIESPMRSLGMTGMKEFFLLTPSLHLRGEPIVNPDVIDHHLSALSEKERFSILGHLFPLSEPPLEDHQSLATVSKDISEKRALFLTRFTTKVQSEGAGLIVELGGKLRIKVPWSTVNHVFLIGKPPVTTGIIYRALADGIPVTFMDMTGRTRGNLYPEDHDLPYYSEIQKMRADDADFCLPFVREIVHAKVHNASVILSRNGVDATELRKIIPHIQAAKDIESLRGYEGKASALFFESFSRLVQSFEFITRNYHPPHDPVNAMLSFTYSLIYNRLASLLRAGGLNPRIGLYHSRRGRHAALASDLMEELRHIAERVVLKVIHRAEVSPDEFALRTWKGQTVCEISRQVITLLVTRFEEAMHTEAAMYDGTDVYRYMQGMVRRFKRFIKGEAPYRALRIR